MKMEPRDSEARDKVISWLAKNGVSVRSYSLDSQRNIHIWSVEANLVMIFDMWDYEGKYQGFEILGAIGPNNVDETIKELEERYAE